MGFKVLAKLGPDEDPVVIHEITDRRVTRVGLVSSTGETGAAGISPDQTEILLTFDFSSANGVPTLQDLEAISHPSNLTGEEVEERQAKLAELPSATNVGPSLLEAPAPTEDDDETPSYADDSSTDVTL